MDEFTQMHVPASTLARIELFQELPEAELQHLADRLRTQYAPRGTVLWRAGDAGDALYIIKSGQVKVMADEGRGQPNIRALLGPGASFGETSLLTGEGHSRTIEVTIDAVLWILSKADFDEMLQSHPAIAINLSRTLARRLRLTEGTHSYATAEELKRIVGVLGDQHGMTDFAHRLIAHSLHQVLLLDVVDTGDENSTIDPSDPFQDIVPLSDHLHRLDVAVELSSGDFSEVVSHLLHRYDHLLVRLPYDGGPYLRQALDICEVVVSLDGNEVEPEDLSHSIKLHIPKDKLWKIKNKHGRGDRARHEREMDRLARRLVGKRVGVALSSGGAHGLAHIGVLWALEQEKIPIDFISGTSMGALIAGAYAAGRRGKGLYRAGQELARLLQVQTGWRYWDLTLPRSGAIKGNIVKRRIDRWVGGKRFEDLEIPAFIAAAEVVSGRGVLFNSGPLAEAIRASISVPLFFEPVPYGDDYLIDGAAVDPVPCACLAEAGADIIIACNVIPQVADRLYRGVRQRVGPGRPPRMLDVSQSEREIMSAQVAVLKMQPYDVLIRPKVGMYSWTEAQHIDEFVQRGLEAARAALPEIRERLKPGAPNRRRVLL